MTNKSPDKIGNWKPAADMCVLAILRSGAKHGYQIAEAIKNRSNGFFDYSYGTLYPALHKLEKLGLVESQWEVASGDKPKRVYTLTNQGQTVLEQELSNCQASANAFLKLVEAI